MHADSTLLKANASLEGRVPRKLWKQLEQAESAADQQRDEDASDGPPPATAPHPPVPPAKAPHSLNERLVSPVDPDAATSTRKAGGTTLGYRDHRLVDDRCGIILATLATPADRDDGAMLQELLGKQEQYTHALAREVVGDSMYGTRANYELLERANIKAYLKKRRGKDSPKVSWLKLLPRGCFRDRAAVLAGGTPEKPGRRKFRRGPHADESPPLPLAAPQGRTDSMLSGGPGAECQKTRPIQPRQAAHRGPSGRGRQRSPHRPQHFHAFRFAPIHPL